MKQEREVQGPRGVNQKESPGQRDGEGGGGGNLNRGSHDTVGMRFDLLASVRAIRCKSQTGSTVVMPPGKPSAKSSFQWDRNQAQRSQ